MVASDRLFAESVQKSQGRKLGKRAGVPSMTDDQARDGNQEDELPFDEELPFELSLDAWRGLTMGLDGSGRDVPLPLPDEPAPGVSNVESHGFSHSPDIFEGCSGASPDRVDRSSKAGLSSDVMGTCSHCRRDRTSRKPHARRILAGGRGACAAFQPALRPGSAL